MAKSQQRDRQKFPTAKKAFAPDGVEDITPD